MDRMFRRSLARSAHPAVLGGILLATAIVLMPASNAEAGLHSPSQDAKAKDPAKLVEDFLHYVLIAKPDLAEATGQALFDSGITDEQLADIVSERDLGEKVDRALQRGRSMAGVGPMVTQFERRLEDGRLSLARNQGRIKEALQMLKGTMRAKMLGTRRLVEAGEYAVPELLEVLVKGNDPEMELAVTKVLEEIKRQAVLPLCAALPGLSPEVQVKVVRILGAIGWPTAFPYLLDVSKTIGTTADVRQAAMQVFRRLGGTSTDAAAAYGALARKFFNEEQSLVAYPSDPNNVVWSYGTHSGLVATPVPTDIFSQVMAMKAAKRAMELQPNDRIALSLYVAADLRRENQLGSGQVDPFAGDVEYSPQFFATASGSDIVRSVLAMAIDSSDTALVRDSIAALGETSGTGAKFRTGQREPLLECLRYPDRRVQFDAALVLGSRLPRNSFPGDGQVVPLLASAVRAGGESYAIVIASSDENRNQLAGLLRDDGFTLLNGGASFYEVEPEIIRSSGVDLIVVDVTPRNAREIVAQARNFDRTSATPLIVVADRKDTIQLDREFASDRATGLWISGTSADALSATIEHLLQRAAGGRISQADSLAYTRDALGTLRTIALEQSSVYDVRNAEAPLLQAMGTITGAMRLLVAEVVALVPSPRCQRALIDAALSSQGDEQKQLLDFAAESARRIGKYADARQVTALRKLIADSAGTDKSNIADAAGRLYGSLNLSPDQAVKLITE